MLNSPLGRHLTGSKAENYARVGVALSQDLVNYTVIGAFILWVGTAIIAAAPIAIPALSVVAASSAVAWLGGSAGAFWLGGAVGVFCMLKSLTGMPAQQLEHNENVYNALAAQYRNSGLTKLEEFERLEALVNERKRNIQALRDRLTLAQRQQIEHSQNEKILLSYNLSHADVYNDYYFENQKHDISTWTWTKKVMNRIFEPIGGGETWIYYVRNACLATGVAGGLVAAGFLGGPVTFFVLAGVAAVVGGGLRLAAYQLERNRRHRVAFANTIDERISYLRKTGTELGQLEQLIDHKVNAKKAPGLKPAEQEKWQLGYAERRNSIPCSLSRSESSSPQILPEPRRLSTYRGGFFERAPQPVVNTSSIPRSLAASARNASRG